MLGVWKRRWKPCALSAKVRSLIIFVPLELTQKANGQKNLIRHPITCNILKHNLCVCLANVENTRHKCVQIFEIKKTEMLLVESVWYLLYWCQWWSIFFANPRAWKNYGTFPASLCFSKLRIIDIRQVVSPPGRKLYTTASYFYIT